MFLGHVYYGLGFDSVVPADHGFEHTGPAFDRVDLELDLDPSSTSWAAAVLRLLQFGSHARVRRNDRTFADRFAESYALKSRLVLHLLLFLLPLQLEQFLGRVCSKSGSSRKRSKNTHLRKVRANTVGGESYGT